MGLQDDLLDLVGEIHDAAVEPELWGQVLARLSDALRGALVTVHLQDSAGRILFFRAIHDDPYLTEKFQNGNEYTDPQNTPMSRLLAAKPATFMLREAIQSDAEFRRSAIYNDIIRPQNLWHWGFASLVKEELGAAILGVLRAKNSGTYEQEELVLIDKLIPHIQRALQIALRLNTFEAQAKMTEEVLDYLPVGIVFLDVFERVIYMNRAAEKIVTAADGVALQGKHLVASLPSQSNPLRRLIRQAALTSQGHGHSAGGNISISRRCGKSPLGVLVAPLRPQTTRLGTNRPAVVLFIHDSETDCHPAPEVLGQLYDLTPRQATLAAHLAGGQSLDDAAAALKITRNTARAHLRLIFVKTGVQRQAELVRLVLGGPATLKSR